MNLVEPIQVVLFAEKTCREVQIVGRLLSRAGNNYCQWSAYL